MNKKWRLPEELWKRLEQLLPAYPVSPLGERPRQDLRTIADGIFYILRTGCQWKALSATGICSASTAHSRFQHWVQAGVFARLWDVALQDDDELIGLEFEWLALDGSLHKAPLGGKKNGPQPLRPRQRRRQAQPLDKSVSSWGPMGPLRG